MHGLLYQLRGFLLEIQRRLLLPLEVPLEQVHGLVLAHLLRADYQGLVASYLEVFDLGLRIGYQGVAQGLRLGLL